MTFFFFFVVTKFSCHLFTQIYDKCWILEFFFKHTFFGIWPQKGTGCAEVTHLLTQYIQLQLSIILGACSPSLGHATACFDGHHWEVENGLSTVAH